MSLDLEDRLRSTPRPARAPAPLGELQSSGDIRLLILDDDPATCAVIQAALSNRDFQIDVVSEPSQVEAALGRTGYYNLIIMDYVIPGLDPDGVFNWIKEKQPDANIVVVTGYPSVDSALSCLRARTYDYLTKPFQVDHLREIVIRCLESKGLLRMTEEALRESLGAAIRERRKSQGFTLSVMSDKTGVSLGYLSQIELGKNSASIETLYRICLALGIKMSELFTAVQRHQGATGLATGVA